VHIPRQTRILLITDEQEAHRELLVSRRLVIGLLVTAAVALLLVVVMLLGYGQAVAHARRVSQMAQRLEAAEKEAASATALRQELDNLRSLQERLLAMLGVDQDAATADTASTRRAPGASLQEHAAGIVTPRPSAWPVTGYVTREFTADDGHPANHPGIDIAQPAGTPILAPGDGTVARVGTDPFLGNFLELQHGLGYLTVYGHCSRVVVRAGVPVRRGQVIGYTGQTGEAAAPHLHFEIWRDGQPINPREVLRGDPSPA
jgi:murein DD-endopeptidase MepM/ murein hydrolase activator NlpD